MADVRYAVVTPARDEAAFIEQTLRSVVGQTIQPAAWVVVDDGSADETRAIVERYASEHQFVRLMDAGERALVTEKDRLSLGAEIVAFNVGLATLCLADLDFIVKLDADMRFEPDYFERLFAHFDADPALGIAGGLLYEEHDGRLVPDRDPPWHVRGATKVYRRACFEDIGGLLPLLGWDGADEAQAYLAGWRTRSFDEPSCVHLRPQGTSGGGALHGRARLGLASYVLRYHPIWVGVRSLRLAAKKPYVLGGFAYLFGYLRAILQRPPRLEDRAAARYIRRAQLQRILGARPYDLAENTADAATPGPPDRRSDLGV